MLKTIMPRIYLDYLNDTLGWYKDNLKMRNERVYDFWNWSEKIQKRSYIDNIW